VDYFHNRCCSDSIFGYAGYKKGCDFDLVVVWALLGILANQGEQEVVGLAVEVTIVILLVAIAVTVVVSKFKR
jgi:hypothetical protein